MASGAIERRKTACDHVATVSGIGTVSDAAPAGTASLTALRRNDKAAFARVVLALSEDGCVSRASSATKRARSGAGEMPSDCAMAIVPPGTGTSCETPPAAARCI